MAFFAEDVHFLARCFSILWLSIFFSISWLKINLFCFSSTVQVSMEGYLYGRLVRVLERGINRR